MHLLDLDPIGCTCWEDFLLILEAGMDTIRVILAEEHDGVRAGLRALLSKEGTQIEIVGEASSGVEAIQLCQQLSPDVLLLDIRFPDINGAEVTRRLRSAGAPVHIFVISAFFGPTSKNAIRELVGCCIDGCITKDEAIEWLVPAIQSVAKGERWFSPIVQPYLTGPSDGEPDPAL